MKIYNKGQADIQWGEPKSDPLNPQILRPGKFAKVKDEKTAQKLLKMHPGVLIDADAPAEEGMSDEEKKAAEESEDEADTSERQKQLNVMSAPVQETDEELVAKADDFKENDDGSTTYYGKRADGSDFSITVPAKDADDHFKND